MRGDPAVATTTANRFVRIWTFGNLVGRQREAARRRSCVVVGLQQVHVGAHWQEGRHLRFPACGQLGPALQLSTEPVAHAAPGLRLHPGHRQSLPQVRTWHPSEVRSTAPGTQAPVSPMHVPITTLPSTQVCAAVPQRPQATVAARSTEHVAASAAGALSLGGAASGAAASSLGRAMDISPSVSSGTTSSSGAAQPIIATSAAVPNPNKILTIMAAS